MPRFTILSAGNPDQPGYNQITMDLLKTVDAELKLRPYRTEAELFEALQGVDGVTQGGVNYPRHVVEAMPERVRIIGSGGIGVDFVDVEAATERGIIVYNLIGVFEREVAHQAMMLLLAQARQLLPINKAMVTRAPSFQRGIIQHLYGQTLGLVSFGNIGQAMAKIAAGFEFRILAFDPFVSQEVADEYGVTMVDQETLFTESDFISCHAPLTKGTYHLIGEQDFKRMKPSAHFINTGRGPVVDEAALIKALQEGWIAGAGLDVLETEPPAPDNPLLEMAQVTLTPHYASSSERGSAERHRKAGEQLVALLSGRWPEDGLVNPEVKPLAAEKWGMPA
jgi:D-3-phosphoglycerate dehydrogenase / 2-oxoglutarate reductase